MNDNYTHDNMDIIYVTESIPGPAENTLEYDILLSNFNSLMLDNCTCKTLCVKMVCRCLQLSNGDNYNRYTYDGGELKHRLNHKLHFFVDFPIIECNSNCTCPPTCGNRVVQNGPLEGLVVKQCEDEQKGLGLFTNEFILEGTFICEYAGELLTRSQAIQRSADNEAKGKMNYIFCLNEHTYDGPIQTFVDPSLFGNIGRYINHSCRPNSSIMPVRTESAIPHLAVFACRDILPGDEITFHYCLGTKLRRNSANKASKTDKKRKICLCKSENCEAFLPCEDF